MKYALDTEFIDTPECSALISLALVCEDGREAYWEFDYPKEHLTPWLVENVVPHLGLADKSTFKSAAKEIYSFTKNTRVETWAYYGAYDFYWLCRIFGGLMELPVEFERYFHEYAEFGGLPQTSGPQHFALYDARVLMQQMATYWKRQKQCCAPNLHEWIPIGEGQEMCQQCRHTRDIVEIYKKAREGYCEECKMPLAICKHAYES